MAAESSSRLNRTQMRWAWIITTLIVLILGYGITDWRGIAAGLRDGRTLVAFVAGYTLPLTVGIGLSTGLMLYNYRFAKGIDGPHLAFYIGAILIISGLAASYLGLGRAPAFSWVPSSAPIYVALPMMAAMGYVNSYGVPLALSSAAIGITLALQIDNMLAAIPAK